MSRRPALTSDGIIRAAVRVADRGGIGQVSMRNVGKELGVEAMSLYHHLAGKDALLDGLADWAFARIEPPEPSDPWRQGMTRRAASARQTLAQHPWALGLLESRRSPGPALLAHHDAVLGSLRRNGFWPAWAPRCPSCAMRTSTLWICCPRTCRRPISSSRTCWAN